MANIRIAAVEVYHPNKVVNNTFYLDHYRKQGKDITNFLKAMGRNNRYIIDPTEEENATTMAVMASKRVLEKAGIEGKEIDMIILSSQVPENIVPTNAMFVHHAIGAKKDTVIYDMNANCAGMTIAVEQASRYLLSNKHMDKALIVGSDYLSLLANPDDSTTYPNFGDAAAAVILEKTEEDTGFIDAMFEVDSTNKHNIVYPENGLSSSLLSNTASKYMLWHPFDGAMSLPYTYEMFEKIVKRNNLQIEDIDMFCFSQFALSNIKRIQERFDFPDDKYIFVGDTYGYTGTNSPFIALYEGIESGRIKRGNTILFWTIGAGHEFISMLFKY